MTIRRAGVWAVAGLLAAATAGVPPAVRAGRSSRALRPTEFREAVALQVAGNTRSYWTCDGARALTLSVRGPGSVRLITRLALAGAGEGGDYEVVVTEGEREVARRAFSVRPAVGVTGGSAPAWGRHRNLAFEIPPGRHEYRVDVTDEGMTVAVRPRYVPPPRRPRRVSITPTTYERVLTLLRDEKEISYYRVTPDTPLTLTVVGPTVLQVNTRLDFDRLMKGGSHGYAIEVCEEGTILEQATFEVTRSQVTAWRGLPEIVPGIVKSFRVEIDEGPHALEIRFKNAVAPGAGVKLYLPAEDVTRK